MNQPLNNTCPLRAIAPIGATSGPATCIEEQCAWWDGSRCAMLSIAVSLDSLNTGGIATYQTN